MPGGQPKLLSRPERGWAQLAELRRGIPLRADLAGLARALATVGMVSLFTRNADVDIPTGTQVEMVLQRPLQLEEENLAGVGPARSRSGAGAGVNPAKADDFASSTDYVPAGKPRLRIRPRGAERPAPHLSVVPDAGLPKSAVRSARLPRAATTCSFQLWLQR